MSDGADFDLAAVREVFRAEVDEHLSAMELALVALETKPDDVESVNTIFRGAHSIKGAAASLGFAAVSEFAHAMESLLDRVRNQSLAVSSDLITLLLRGVDSLRRLNARALAGGEGAGAGELAIAAEMDRFGVAQTRAASARAAAAPQIAGEPASDEPRVWNRRADDEFFAGRRTLRVDVEKLDLMLNLAGEIAISRAHVRQLLGEHTGALGSAVLEAHAESDRLHVDLQELIMKARMVPVGPVLRPFVRIVRDLSRAQGKLAQLVLEGEETELDTGVVDHLRDPLTHMIRNSIDHGLETPEARRRAGKPEVGTIRLSARHESGRIVVAISDDGRGLDKEKIRARALERGNADAARMTEGDLFRLIFEAGFSTADRVTGMSGRGVGMDVVKRNVDALQGSVSVHSVEGQGATFTVRLPLTLAIINGFVVHVSDDTFVMPMDAVVECLALPEGAGRNLAEGKGVLNHRGEALPFVRLRWLFGIPGDPPPREKVVVVRHEQARVGLCVDRLLGESQTVVKPLGRLFQKARGVSGSAILGTGRVALILDIPELLQDVGETALPMEQP